ncbi:MAG: exosortase A-associated hydrolase 1 [Halioglobus sp.]|jgi:exosortase A-associated hydrolase 1
MSDYEEQGLVFDCGDNRLVGILSLPEEASDVGVLFLVGGPQYRVGSHRQFTLLARSLAEAGVASLRFDYEGMGDSEGTKRNFAETEGELFAAIEAFFENSPGLSRIILWGLCDGASTAMMYGHRFPQVAGMILLNPWVHSGEYSPGFKVSQYYRPLLAQRDQWGRLLRGQVSPRPALRDLGKAVLSLLPGRRESAVPAPSSQSFVQEMQHGLARFKHDVLIILSEEDFTAKEFSTLIAGDNSWKESMRKPGATLHTIADADHTFSKRIWQDEVTQVTIDWVKS